MSKMESDRSMLKTRFHISAMDGPAEEQLIRIKLEGMAEIHSLLFDIAGSTLDVFHTGDPDHLFATLVSLQLDTKLVSSDAIDTKALEEGHARQRRVLWQVLIINFFFFALEILTGFIAGSMGLVADSLDMLADSIVYGLSLFAVGGSTWGAQDSEIIAIANERRADVLNRFLLRSHHNETSGFQSVMLGDPI